VYASAGHAGAFLRRAGEVRRLDVTGPIVGVDPSARYEARTLQLVAGDLLMLVTDGLTEARDGRGNMLAEVGAMTLLRQAPTEPQQCADDLVRRAHRYSGGALKDDLALLAIAFDGVAHAAAPAQPASAVAS
jgi:sigma-B regulation protein RsbU (phosphoserine phosphatase)